MSWLLMDFREVVAIENERGPAVGFIAILVLGGTAGYRHQGTGFPLFESNENTSRNNLNIIRHAGFELKM